MIPDRSTKIFAVLFCGNINFNIKNQNKPNNCKQN